MLRTWIARKEGELTLAIDFDYLSEIQLRWAINWRFELVKQGFKVTTSH